MPTMDLDKGYRYQGAVYGPGRGIDVPEAVAEVVRASRPRQEQPAPAEPAAPEDTSGDGQASGPLAELQGVNNSVRQALADAGFDSPDAIRAASDEQLSAVDGVGQATLAKIREAMQA